MEFQIPSSKDDLLSRKDARQYVVEDLLTARQIAPALSAYKAACQSPRAVAEHFDTFFSILCLHKDLSDDIKSNSWTGLLEGCYRFSNHLSSILEESDLSREERLNYLNGLKMNCYLLCQYMEMFESMDTKLTTLSVKGKGRKKRSDSCSTDWNEEKEKGLQQLNDFIKLPLLKLWSPPVVDEEFVSMISSCVCKLLENPSATKNRESLVTIAHILGHLVQRYNHGLSMSLKLDQLLKHFEFLVSPLAQIIEIMVNEHRCKSTIADIFREIGNTSNKETAKDTTAAKNYAGFMVELSERLPSIVLAYVPVVIDLLDKEPYTLRNGVLGMLGEIIVRYLSKETDDKLRITRDHFLDKLENHITDVNAFVRSKTLQIWQTITSEGCLPLTHQELLMAAVVGRLKDVSVIVRRYALQLVTALLKTNSFSCKLTAEDLKVNYEKEKLLLDQMAPENVVSTENETVSQEWKQIKDELALHIDEFINNDKDISNLISDGDSSDSVLSTIVQHIDHKEWMDALMLASAALDSFPTLSIFTPQTDIRKSSLDEEEMDTTGQDTNKLLSAVKEIYFSVKCPVQVQDTEDQTVAKQKTLVQYLQITMTFSAQVQQCIPVICKLLCSKNSTDVIEAIQFFVTAVQLGVSAAHTGIRHMMKLIWSKEASIREAVVQAFTTLYLSSTEINKKKFASSVVDNLSSFFVGMTLGDLMSFEALIAELVGQGHIDKDVIRVLWNRFTKGAQDALWAINLLAMCAGAEPGIVSSNLEVLVGEGLGPNGEKDYLLAQGTCKALLKCVTKASKEKGKLQSQSYRLGIDHNIFTRLQSILLKGVTDATRNGWIPLCELALEVIYKLCDMPAKVAADLLKQLFSVMKQICSDEMALQQAAGEGDGEGLDNSAKSSLVSCVMARVLFAAGEVAFRQMVFMEVDVLTEMKRRQALNEENKKGRRKSKGTDISKASELEEDMALAGASADDTEAEFIKFCLSDLLIENSLLAQFVPIIVEVCNNSARFPDPLLQKVASLALAKFCLINEKCCDQHLQLLFTLLEKSSSSIIRSNLIIALSDLSVRFPNLIEPWTPHLYARLRDSSSDVRKTTLNVLTHLILNDMVKVKGQISELAVCIVDPDVSISGQAKLFFHELAKKSNSMYNMPDIISRLSDPDIGVSQDHFQAIIKYIFSVIDKSKQCESLVEKLCHRFRGTRTDRQVQDLSFCLSQLNYKDKGLAKLIENFSCYSDKLVDPVVYNHFSHILNKSKQLIKTEAKTNLEEFENKIKTAHTKGLDGTEETSDRLKPSVCVKEKKTKTRSKAGAKSNKENEEDDGDNVQRPRRSVRARRSKYTIESDDDEFFDIGTEGQKEIDLEEDDNQILKPSQKRSKRGKVALTPTSSPNFL
ncbi:condensin complex subunit 1 [Biomphalaria glabrata]|nr:condensin complex subunit 1-like [Biomphalaria glabrata]